MLFFHAHKDGKIVSTELVLVSRDDIYSFLGGTDSVYFYCRPNDFLKHSIIGWGIKNDKKRYVIGGGYNCETDGIYEYKKSFAPLGDSRYSCYKIVFDPDQYDLLSNGNNDYFPFYRSQ